MVRNPSRPDAGLAIPGGEPHVARAVACPMCHSPAPLTPSALDAWRCGRCGQQWDDARLTAVAAYAAWVARDRTERRSDTP